MQGGGEEEGMEGGREGGREGGWRRREGGVDRERGGEVGWDYVSRAFLLRSCVSAEKTCCLSPMCRRIHARMSQHMAPLPVITGVLQEVPTPLQTMASGGACCTCR
jgi:hypothetical protein